MIHGIARVIAAPQRVSIIRLACLQNKEKLEEWKKKRYIDKNNCKLDVVLLYIVND